MEGCLLEGGHLIAGARGKALLFSCTDSAFLGNTVIPFREKSRGLLVAVYSFI